MENNSLNSIVKYASIHTKYYKKLFQSLGLNPSEIKTIEDLNKLPVLTKNSVQENHDDFISDEYQKYPKNNNILVKRTSGSTGKCLKIFWDYEEDIKSLNGLWMLRQKQNGITPENKWCSFFSAGYEGNKIIEIDDEDLDKSGKHLSFSKIGLNYNRVVEIYKKMIDFAPEWLMLQPSIGYIFAEIIEKENLPPIKSLKYIELNGEFLFDNYRKKIEDVFKVKVINMYSCSETNQIAYEYPDGKMHINTNNVFLEVIKDGRNVYGEEGYIYVTSLKNNAMPFIRYETGDKGILEKKETDNGVEYILELKSGRSSDYIFLENGEKLNCYVFDNAIEYTNENMHFVIKQFQIIQNNINKFTVRLVINQKYNGWKEAVQESFLSNIKEEQLKNAEWNFVWLDSICHDPETGKYKFFINEVK